MCGIAGIIDFRKKRIAPELLQRMIGYLSHRGPDSCGIYSGQSAGLAHARLSIIDISNKGDQPIHNENRTVWIVFNGEIFNYPDLRKGLEENGHRFYTQTDTEILVHMYEELGPDMLDKLNGQFAFAIWDACQARLFLARDRMGIRPLYYHFDGNRLVFGSEIKAIFADPGIPRHLNAQTLSDVFTCWTPVDGQTPFQDIHQIPAGHFALFSADGFSVQSYWQISFDGERSANDDRTISIEASAGELEALLTDATRIRLRADVPVGAYLSGGLDSTLTSAIVKRKFNNRLRTFSVGFSDSKFDESRYQTQAVSSLETEHSQVVCTEHDIGIVFPDVVWHAETPLLRTAPAPLYCLARLVRESEFKVFLTGEGADEVFAGYNIFKEDRVRRFWARNPDSTLRPQLLRKLYPYVFSGNDRSWKFLTNFFKKGLTDTDSPVYSHMLRWANTVQLRNFFTEDLQRRTGDLQQFVERYQTGLPGNFSSWSALSRAQFHEIRLFLRNYLLSSQGDRMGMAHAVEGRFPFLDHHVVEFGATLPPDFKMAGLEEKRILKAVAKKFIPRDIAERTKQPYRAPITRCFFGKKAPDYVSDLLSDTCVAGAGCFDPRKVSRLSEKCRQKDGNLLSERENMALAGTLSTQLLHHYFVKQFPSRPAMEPEYVKWFGDPAPN